MGHRLYREVLDHAPADLTLAELVVWLVLADDANDDTRTGWLDTNTLWRRCRLKRRQVADALAKLAERGFELRVVRGTDKSGRPVYAYRGSRRTYRMPVLNPVDNPPERVRATAPIGGERVRQSAPISPERVRQNVERVRQRAPLPLNTPQVLSPQAPLTRVHEVLLANGAANREEAERLAVEIQTRNPGIGNLAAYLAGMADRGNLAPAVAKIRAEQKAATAADQARQGKRCHRCAVRYVGEVCPQCGTPRRETP